MVSYIVSRSKQKSNLTLYSSEGVINTDIFIYTPNDDDQNYPYCWLESLNTSSLEPTNQI